MLICLKNFQKVLYMLCFLKIYYDVQKVLDRLLVTLLLRRSSNNQIDDFIKKKKKKNNQIDDCDTPK